MSTPNERKQERRLTTKDLRKTFTMWYFSTELSNSYDRLQGLAFGNALAKRLKKLYANQTEAYSEALSRNLEFYNSEGTFGALILGITLSLEEEKAKGQEMPGEMITGLKTGLMGPLAGLGDTLIWGTLRPIILGLTVAFALNGQVLGLVLPFLFPLFIFILGYHFLKMGYREGRASVMRILQSGTIHSIIKATGILGLFIMGALSANYITVHTPLVFERAGTQPIIVQDLLNQMIPGLLPLLAVVGIYFYFTKIGQNYTKLVAWIFGLSLVASYFGIL